MQGRIQVVILDLQPMVDAAVVAVRDVQMGAGKGEFAGPGVDLAARPQAALYRVEAGPILRDTL